MNKKARKPDLVLMAMNTETGDRTGKIGAGWLNEDGSVSVRLDDGVCIQQQRGVIFTLFPNNRPESPEPEEFPGVVRQPFDQRKRW
jgi:hypothetical protein